MCALRAGDIAPRLVGPSADGSLFDLAADRNSGKFWALVFCRGDYDSTLEEFARVYDRFAESGTGVIGVSASKSDLGRSLPFPVLLDVEDATFRAYGVPTANAGASAVTVLLRPNGHVLEILTGSAQADQALAILNRSRATDAGASITTSHPPVLIVPDVLSQAECRALVSFYRNSTAPLVHFSEIKNTDSDVKTQIPDYGRKDRIDHMLITLPSRQSIARLLRSRLIPEIKKAFQYDVTTFEALRIARYEGERRGLAHGHRDNTRPEVAQRRFAMSLNLNSEEFSGGELRFPEYGPRLYKPDTGAAIVFSCSLLHEALEVTAGRRFSLVTFFFSER